MTEEATVDCYNEYEGFAGMLATLEDRLELPLQSKVLGETVEVIGLDDEQSSKRRSVVAKVGLGERQNTVALACNAPRLSSDCELSAVARIVFPLTLSGRLAAQG